MGKKLDALLGRTFKAAKFKAIANLAISRLAVLKNQRQARLRLARSDVLELLQLGHLERASLRVRYIHLILSLYNSLPHIIYMHKLFFSFFSRILLTSNRVVFYKVEHVIKDQNMLDVYDRIEGYCNLLIERVHLIEQERLV